jgi:hypothetical protein
VVVPPYCTTRQGKVFRVERMSELVAPDRVRYVLRAVPVKVKADNVGLEVAREMDTASLRDKLCGRPLRRPRRPTNSSGNSFGWTSTRITAET